MNENNYINMYIYLDEQLDGHEKLYTGGYLTLDEFDELKRSIKTLKKGLKFKLQTISEDY